MPGTHQWPNGLIAALATVGALVVAAWGVEPLTAQEVAGDIEVRGSFGYEYRRQLREGLRGFGTLQYEETADLSGKVGDNSRVETTGGVSLDLSPRWRLEGGLGLYHDRFLESRDAWETRLWQAVTVDWPDGPEWSRRLARRFVVSHRLRLEERFNKIEDWEFSLRLRYRIGLAWAINKYSVERCPLRAAQRRVLLPARRRRIGIPRAAEPPHSRAGLCLQQDLAGRGPVRPAAGPRHGRRGLPGHPRVHRGPAQDRAPHPRSDQEPMRKEVWWTASAGTSLAIQA